MRVIKAQIWYICKDKLEPITIASFDVLFASTLSIARVTNWWVIETTRFITFAWLASFWRYLIVIGRATVALFTDYAWFAFAFAGRVALGTQCSIAMTVAVNAFVCWFSSIVGVFAVLAVGTVRVALTVDTVATVACLVVKRLVEYAFVR
jgi:hypothetical protein